MKRSIATAGNFIARKAAEHPWAARAGAAVLVGALAACGSTEGAPSGGESSPAGIASAANNLHLPASWPARGALPDVDCGFGKTIQHQVARQLAGKWALQADTRCQPPFGQEYAGVYPDAGYTPAAIGRIYNGEWVEVDCATDGTPVNDPRNPAEYNPTWYGITFADQHDGNKVKAGLVNGDNLGNATQNAHVGAPIPNLPAC